MIDILCQIHLNQGGLIFFYVDIGVDAQQCKGQNQFATHFSLRPRHSSKACTGVFLVQKILFKNVVHLELCVIMIRVLILMSGLLIKIQAFMFSLTKGNKSKAPRPLCRLNWLPWLQCIYKWNIFGTTIPLKWVDADFLLHACWSSIICNNDAILLVNCASSGNSDITINTRCKRGTTALHCEHVFFLCDWLLKWDVFFAWHVDRAGKKVQFMARDHQKK